MPSSSVIDSCGEHKLSGTTVTGGALYTVFGKKEKVSGTFPLKTDGLP
jgi:hypothetical protein